MNQKTKAEKLKTEMLKSDPVSACQHFSISAFQRLIRAGAFVFSFFTLHSSFAESTNALALPYSAPALAPSMFRVLGALALVIAIFLGGVWLYRNWHRLVIHRGRAPKLNVLETRSLGGRQAIYVVAYDQERFLLSSSPNGVNLLSHLPEADGESPNTVNAVPQVGTVNAGLKLSFAQTLMQMVKTK